MKRKGGFFPRGTRNRRLDAIEAAIRGALEKGDANDRAFREKVYRSVFTALERSIAGNPALTEEVAQRRRETLKARITEIEQEFQPARPPAPPRAEPVRPVAASNPPGAAEPRAEAPPVVASRTDGQPRQAPAPSIDAPEPAGGRHLRDRFAREEPAFSDLAADRAEPGPAGDDAGIDFTTVPSRGERLSDRETERRRRPWAVMFAVVTLLAALAIGGWWVVGSGLFGRPDTSVPNPPVETTDADFDPEPAAPLGPGSPAADREWVTVFSPTDPTSVIAPSGTSADIIEEEGQPFMRIRAGSGEAVRFDVGQGILERLAGRRAVFDLVARAEEGRETQVSVQCDFGELGNCGRRRYLVGTHRADYLFEVELPSGRPGAAGTIGIISDVDGDGKAIDIFEIRVSLAE